MDPPVPSACRLLHASPAAGCAALELARLRPQLTKSPIARLPAPPAGFVWDADGHIVTNYHVIRGAADVRVSSPAAAGTRRSDAHLLFQNLKSPFLQQRSPHPRDLWSPHHCCCCRCCCRRCCCLLLQVTLTGGEGRQAKVVGYDDDKDVAVLKIDLKDLVGLYCLYCLHCVYCL